MLIPHEQLIGLTQSERLLLWLRTGRTITPMQGWDELGIYRVGDPVHKLRKRGLRIRTEDKEVPNRFGESCLVGLYSLEPINEAEKLDALAGRGFWGYTAPTPSVSTASWSAHAWLAFIDRSGSWILRTPDQLKQLLAEEPRGAAPSCFVRGGECKDPPRCIEDQACLELGQAAAGGPR